MYHARHPSASIELQRASPQEGFVASLFGLLVTTQANRKAHSEGQHLTSITAGLLSGFLHSRLLKCSNQPSV